MLIASERHSAEDLELWAELEAIDLTHDRRGLERRASRSRAAILEFLVAGPSVCFTSWGKDSVVLCHLLYQTRPEVPVVNLRVRPGRNPYCDAVRDEFLRRWPLCVYEEEPVDYRSVAADAPDAMYDRETDRFWYAAIERAGARHETQRHITGVSARESGGRRLRCMVWGENSPNGCAPLAWWTSADVFAYLAMYDLPVHPNYAMLGGGRWPRERLRVAEIGDVSGTGMGRREWEREYYGDVLRRIEAGRARTR